LVCCDAFFAVGAPHVIDFSTVNASTRSGVPIPRFTASSWTFLGSFWLWGFVSSKSLGPEYFGTVICFLGSGRVFGGSWFGNVLELVFEFSLSISDDIS
jgi:hypothetical protein